ncbi:MAG TPA: cbb3-type cytochrome c oxidase subunit I [Castellaniella sp.]|uniref:cbb3-type cytochrome c oxidase subunit I n=1 Tax=Castellaniella sp. TaxID=1955812 RepID=UPI002EE0415A
MTEGNLAEVSPVAPLADPDVELTRIFSAYTMCGTIWLIFATAVGVLLALKLVYPELLSTALPLTFGRLRPIHTNDTFYAWASPAMIGLAFYIAAKSSGARLYSTKLAWVVLVLLNVAAIVGTVALDLGFNNGDQEYREWLPWIRMILALALVLTAWNLIGTVARRVGKDIYLSNWYTMGGTLWTIIIFLITLTPWYQHGLGQVAVQGYYMHNAVGMWFTPLCLGIFYYALPKAMNRPIYSYSLGIFAFWTNLAFYPLLGAHHFLFSPLPWWLQTTAIVASVAMFVPVWGGSANYLLTMRGRPERLHRAPAMFILVGVLGYLIGSSQGTIEAFRSMQEIWHLTNFTVGHSHLTMYGFVTFAIWGGIYELLPRATGRHPNNLLMGIHFWLAVVGLVVYVMALSIGGTIQGLDWVAGKPFIDSVVDMAPFWLWRTVGGVLMFVSHLVFAWNVWDMTYRRAPGAGRMPVIAEVGV